MWDQCWTVSDNDYLKWQEKLMWRGSLGIENCFTKADNQSRQTTPTFTKLTFQSQPAVQFVSIKIYFLDWSALAGSHFQLLKTKIYFSLWSFVCSGDEVNDPNFSTKSLILFWVSDGWDYLWLLTTTHPSSSWWLRLSQELRTHTRHQINCG